MDRGETRQWTETPLFVPFNDDHLAAVLTMPSGPPRGLVVLSVGGEGYRSHRFQMWTRTARRLAEQSLASIRFDYLGTGDSTGDLIRLGWRAGQECADQGMAVAEVGMELTGVGRFVAAGNCQGGALSIALANLTTECIGVVSVLMHVILPDPNAGLTDALKKSKIGRIIRDSTVLRQRVARQVRSMVGQTAPEFDAGLEGGLENARILCLYGSEDYIYTPRVKAEYERVIGSLPAQVQERFRLKVLPGERLTRFESLRAQDLVIDETVAWADRCFTDDGLAAPSGHDEAVTSIR